MTHPTPTPRVLVRGEWPSGSSVEITCRSLQEAYRFLLLLCERGCPVMHLRPI